MNVLLVTDAYPPMRTSGATQMFDLGQAFIKEGHQVAVIFPTPSQSSPVEITQQSGCILYSVRAFQTKDVPYWRRTLAEMTNPYWMWNQLQKNGQFKSQKIDGVIWYSPTIFWGPLIKRLKQYFSCSSYLIQRDFFPDWTVDLGLMKKGLAYHFFKLVEKYQYQQANAIGVQSPNNLAYFKRQFPNLAYKAEVLWNWVGDISATPCSINLSKTNLAGRTILVYAGNMGVAQGMSTLLDLAKALDHRQDVGFVFVGRGSEVVRLKEFAKRENLTNTLFFDEIPPSEIEDLYKQCHIGLLALDPRHQTHNIPGKFLTYMKAGLPVFAICNSGNDLEMLIRENHVGVFVDLMATEQIAKFAINFIDEVRTISGEIELSTAALANELFSPLNTVMKITKSF